MGAIFTPEEERGALEVLDSLRTAQNAVGILLQQADSDDPTVFLRTASVLMRLLDAIETSAKPYAEKQKNIKLPLACRGAKISLQEIAHARDGDLRNCAIKLQYELLPMLEEAYMRFYYWAHVHGGAEREKHYFSKEIYELASNRYINAALETGEYRYDVSFLVQAYNHLDYTKRCVESLLKNIPEGLNCELILWDNGSTDETAEYFKSVHPTKIFQSHINWAAGEAPLRIIEGKYCFRICNDVIVLPNAIENALACMTSDDQIAWVVPTTPNVSNLQTIPMGYATEEEMIAEARKNNIQDPYRWEQRTRLCDPISLCRTAAFYSRDGICSEGYLNRDGNMFPDDRRAILLRRRGKRMVLAKDAYCHHFGSVTLKSEIEKQNTEKFYLEGRRGFYDWFGIDPWGTGFCYTPAFLRRVVGEHTGHVEVLGINCGMGSNSLKIKEQIKEYCRNTDCTLSNLTDDARFAGDLKGIGDYAEHLSKIKEFKEFLYQKKFDYIVWDDPFLTQFKFSTLLELCKEHLASNGKLFLRKTEQSQKHFAQCTEDCKLNEEWAVLRAEDENG